MKINVADWSRNSFVSLVVSHENEPPIYFDSGGYRTTRMVQRSAMDDESVVEDALFNEVNDFIARFSDADQQALYECYATVDTLLRAYDATSDIGSNSLGNQAIEGDLREVVKRLYDIITFEKLFQYIQNNRELKIPLELSDTYDTDDKLTPAFIDKTYTLSEYMDLMATVLGFRFMVPIWGPYMKISAAADGNAMKEYNAFMLLEKSSFYKNKWFDRMETYIWANTDKKELNLGPILHHISEERLPTYAIAITSVRKLSIAPLSCASDKHHLMVIMFGYSKNKLKMLGRTLEPGLLSKERIGATYADDNSSVLCWFKLKEQLSIGDIAVFRKFINNYQNAAYRIDPTIDQQKVELCVKSARSLSRKWRASDVQKGLVAWTLSPAITGSVIPLLSRKNHSLDTAMGIAQAILWHWGFHELAIMITAKVHDPDESTFKGVGGKFKISDGSMEKLDLIYTYRAPVKVSPGRGGVTNGTHNTGVRGIELFHSVLAGSDWDIQCPLELAKEYDRSDVAGYIEPSSHLREELAKLLIRLDTCGLGEMDSDE